MTISSATTSGYFLLIGGVVVIIFSLVSVYLVFTKKTQPAPLFDLPGFSIDSSQLLGSALPPGLLNPSANSKPTELYPASALNEMANITGHLILMGFVAGIGYKLASLGVLLLRPIEVKLKTTS